MTGAFSYSGAEIAASPTGLWTRRPDADPSPGSPAPPASTCRRARYRFDDPAALAHSMDGVSTLYNTFWVRFDHGATTSPTRSRAPGCCSSPPSGPAWSGSSTSASPTRRSDPRFPYFRGKALVEFCARPIGRAVLDRAPDLDLRGRARRADEQHRLDPATDAGVRAPGRRHLPRPAGPRRGSRPNLHRCGRRDRRHRDRRSRTRDHAFPRPRRAHPRGRRHEGADPSRTAVGDGRRSSCPRTSSSGTSSSPATRSAG